MRELNKLLLFLPVYLGTLVLNDYHLLAQQSHHDTVITGVISRHSLDSAFKWFGVGYTAYHPNDSAIDALKAFANSLSVTLVIGSWCSDSREHVPPFFKVCDQIGLSEDKITMIGVERKKNRVITAELKRLKVEFVPTFIVYHNGKEIGRIIEDTKVSIEHDLLYLLTRKKRLFFF